MLVEVVVDGNKGVVARVGGIKEVEGVRDVGGCS